VEGNNGARQFYSGRHGLGRGILKAVIVQDTPPAEGTKG